MEESDEALLNCTQLLVADVAQWRPNRSQLLLLLEAALNGADSARRRAFADCLFPAGEGAGGGPDGDAPAPSRPYHLPWWQKLAWTLVFAAMLLVATGGNIIVMWIVLAHRRMRTVTNYFLVNLSLSDLLMALLNCVFNFVFMLNSDWPFGPVYCSINNFVANVTVAASVFTLVAISLDRYMAIVRPLRHRTSRRRAGLALAAIWLCSALLALPCALYSTTMTMRYSSGQTRQVCYMLWPDGRYPTSMTEYVYNIIFLSVTYLGPVTAMAVCYTLMGRELWGSRSIGELTHRQSESIKCKKKVVRMFILVVSIFALCWLPYHGYFIYAYHNKSISTSSYVQHLYLAFYWLAMANAMVNPVIYYWMNNRFRLYFQQVICRCCCLRRRAKTALEMPTLKGRTATATCHSHSELRRSRSGRAPLGVAISGETSNPNSLWRRRTQESHVTLRSLQSLPRLGGSAGNGGGGGTNVSPCSAAAPAPAPALSPGISPSTTPSPAVADQSPIDAVAATTVNVTTTGLS